MTHRAALTALMLGNFLVGITVLAPAGMMAELATGLNVTIAQVGLLITYGSAMLCVGSPLMAWATSRIDRRILLAGTALVLMLGHVATALAPNYAVLLTVRLLMLPIAAVFTPQAASTAALLVPESERPRAISYVFIGWSIAIAIGLLVIAFVVERIGWRATHGAIAFIAAAVVVLVAGLVPKGQRGDAVVLSTWGRLFGDSFVMTLLAVTGLHLAGQFVVFPFLGPLLARFIAADTAMAGMFFATYGIMGFLGSVAATKLVGNWGPSRTALGCVVVTLGGACVWSVGLGNAAAMAVGIALLGTGFAAINGMQQARLATHAPSMASAAIALNTSCIYIGQGVGSAIGGALFAYDMPGAMGWIGVGFMVLALGGLIVAHARDGRHVMPRAAERQTF